MYPQMTALIDLGQVAMLSALHNDHQLSLHSLGPTLQSLRFLPY